jgi:hypothetical protein
MPKDKKKYIFMHEISTRLLLTSQWHKSNIKSFIIYFWELFSFHSFANNNWSFLYLISFFCFTIFLPKVIHDIINLFSFTILFIYDELSSKMERFRVKIGALGYLRKREFNLHALIANFGLNTCGWKIISAASICQKMHLNANSLEKASETFQMNFRNQHSVIQLIKCPRGYFMSSYEIYLLKNDVVLKWHYAICQKCDE